MLLSCSSTAGKGSLRPEDSIHGPTFQALAAAVEAGEDALARRILARLELLPLTEEELAYGEAFEHVLDGREIVRRLDLRLLVRAEGDQYLLLMAASHPGGEPLVLTLPPATLRRTTTTCYLARSEDELRASDDKRLETHASNEELELEILPERVATGELLRFRLPLGGAFAVRDHWELALRSGLVRRGEDSFPIRSPDVRGVEVVRRAPFLPPHRVEPEELVRHAESESATEAGLLERAVRIDSGRRAEALTGLRSVAAALDDARLRRLVPALRWLSGTVKPGADPRAWRAWLRGDTAQARRDGGLDLPD